MNVLGPEVDGARILGRDGDGGHALEPVLQVAGRVAVDVLRADVVLALLAGGLIVDAEPAFAVGVDQRAAEARHGGSGFAAADFLPAGGVVGRGRGGSGARRHADGGLVLLAAEHPVGEPVVQVHLVQLGGGLVELGRPRLAAVLRDIGAAVVGLDEDLRVVGVDPHVVVVTMGRGQAPPRLAAVDGLEEALVVHVHHVGVRRVRVHVGVVERPVHEPGLVAYQAPGLAGVVGAVEPLVRVGGLHQGVDPVRVGGGDGQVTLADEPGGQALRLALPRVATVGGLVDAAHLPAAGDDRPRLTPDVPEGSVDCVGVVRLQLQVHGAHAVAHEQHVLPGLAAVLRAVHATVLRLAERRAQCGRVDQVGVFRVYDDGADLAHVAQAQEPPGPAGVVAAVEAPAQDHVGADAVGARTRVDDGRVGRRQRDGAHGRRREVAVAYVAPGDAVVLRLPHAAARGAHVEGALVDGVARHGGDAAAPGRAHVAELEAAEQ